MYGKIEHGNFLVAPSIIHVEGMTIANPSDEQIRSAGYLPVETSNPPAEDGMQAVPHYTEQDGKIVQTWTMEPIKATKEEQVTIMVRSMAAVATNLTDAVALSISDILPTWEELLAAGQPIQPGMCLTYNGQVYRMVQPTEVTPQAHQPPGSIGMEAIYALIDKEHAGTIADPIPASRNMEYVYGKYYRDPEDGKLYLCKRQGETDGGTIILQYLPHELIGHYFEEVL